MTDRRFRTRRRLLGTLAAGLASSLAAASVEELPSVLPAALGARVATLDPDHIDARDVADVLAQAPAPRIVLLQGSVPLVTMAPFGAFLAAMGYPDVKLRDPVTGNYSVSSFRDSRTLAGQLAAHYERDGVRPMLIGHSQGGMLVVRVLHELAGGFAEAIEVVDPASETPWGRTTFRDPLTSRERPVVGLVLPYASAIATGRLFRVLLGQWSMLERLPRIPDTVEEFTGFAISGDAIAAGSEPYRATGTARVRNVVLPSSYSHIALPEVSHLASDPRARAWIDCYVPGAVAVPADPPFDATNLVHAADIWHSVKRHWCLEVQRLAAASR